MLRLALLELMPNDPESRSPNASPEVLGAAPPFVFWTTVAEVDGVRERGLGVFDADAASMANASYLGRSAPDGGTGLAPSFRAGCDGFTGAVELQRSEKESDMVTDSADGAPGAVFGVCSPASVRGTERRRYIDLTLTLHHGQSRRRQLLLVDVSVDDALETMLSSRLPADATTGLKKNDPVLFFFFCE